MKPNKIFRATLCTAAALSMTAGTFAVAQESGVVKVDIKNVADAIASNANLEASKMPLIVQVPFDVASNVCAVPENVLRQQGGGGGVGCTAMTTSPALEKIVKREVKVNLQQ